MNEKIVFISGKMRGLNDYGRKRFAEAEEKLRKQGYIVLNPAVLPIGMPEIRYLPITISMVEQADAIYMLKGWEQSLGARAEFDYAVSQAKEIIYERAE